MQYFFYICLICATQDYIHFDCLSFCLISFYFNNLGMFVFFLFFSVYSAFEAQNIFFMFSDYEFLFHISEEKLAPIEDT